MTRSAAREVLKSAIVFNALHILACAADRLMDNNSSPKFVLIRALSFTVAFPLLTYLTVGGKPEGVQTDASGE